jgi:hypothetical protein
MLSRGENLERPGKIEEIELGVKSKENINGLVRNRGRLVCSHLAGIEVLGLFCCGVLGLVMISESRIGRRLGERC